MRYDIFIDDVLVTTRTVPDRVNSKLTFEMLTRHYEGTYPDAKSIGVVAHGSHMVIRHDPGQFPDPGERNIARAEGAMDD